jgi:hypothetical protein
MVSLLTLAPYTSAKCAAISPVVNPRADSDSTIPSTPSRRRARLRTMAGSKVPSRSRGTSMSTGPIWSQHRLGAGAVAGVTAIAAHRVVLVIPQVPGHLRLERGLEHRLHQPGQ